MNTNPYTSPREAGYSDAFSTSWPILPRWGIILLLMVLAGLAHFNRVGISVAGSETFIPQLGISETRMGWVYTAFLIVYTLGMLPGGWLIDRIGAARSLALLGLMMGLFVALTGTLGWFTSSPQRLWLSLLVIRGLAGLGNVPLHPGAAHVVSDVAPARGRATANGLVTAGALVGIAACYPVFGWLMDHLTWPWAFIVSGLTLSGYGLVWLWLAGPRLPPPESAAAAGKDKSDSPADRPSLMASLALLGHKDLWLLTLSYAAFGYFQYLFFYWMGYYFKEVLHVPPVEARQYAFFITLCQGGGMAIGGLGNDLVCRVLGRTWGRRSIVMAGMGLGALFGLVAVNRTQAQEVAQWLAFSMAALGLCEGVFWTTATDLGVKSRGFAAAFMNTGGNFGGLISPVLTPFMAEQMGWPNSIAVACAISAAGGFVWFLIQPPAEPAEAAPSQ
jgi:MFS family permease